MSLQFCIAPIAIEVELATFDIIICYLDVFRRRRMGAEAIGDIVSGALHMDGCVACSVDRVLRRVSKERYGATPGPHVKSARYDELTSFQKKMLTLFAQCGFFFWEERIPVGLFMEVYSERRVNPNARPVYTPGSLDILSEKNIQAYKTYCRNDHFHRRTGTANYRPKLKTEDIVNSDIRMLSDNAIYMGLEDPFQLVLSSMRVLNPSTIDSFAPSVRRLVGPLAPGVTLTGQTRLDLGGEPWGSSLAKRYGVPDCVIALFDETSAKGFFDL